MLRIAHVVVGTRAEGPRAPHRDLGRRLLGPLPAARGVLSMVVFTGYRIEALRARGISLDGIDVLVDGPYDRTRPDPRGCAT
jgi:hypothetical protein